MARALCNFHNREIDALMRSSSLMYDGCVDKTKAIKWLIQRLIPEYASKIDLELQRRKDKERNKRKSISMEKVLKPALQKRKKKSSAKTPKAKAKSGSTKVRNV